MSLILPVNVAATEDMPLYQKRAAEKALNYGPALFALTNAEQLRQFQTAKCYEGLAVFLHYLHDPRDFGGGVFVWKASDPSDDNNGTAIRPYDNSGVNGCWRRQESLGQPGFINIKWFGAIPFLQGFDNAPIINAAIQTLPRFQPAYDLTINGGYMRTGICYIPAGEWYVSDTIVASGGMTVRGDGTTASTLTLNNNCPLFDGVPLRMITAYTKQTQSTIGGRPMVWSFPVARITFSTPHGYAPGEQISGLIEGLAGNDVDYHTNGRWYRFHALNSTQVEFLDYGPTPTSFAGAFVEFEKFILDFQWTEGSVADNDVFGTQCRSLSVVGAALTNNQNARSSGIYILGAQDSVCEDVRIWTTGIRGIHLAVPANRVGVANIVRGPGIYTTNGYLIKHGVLHSEHVNQQATHLISDYNNPPIPRAAFMITNCFHARFQHIQGENSPLEVHIRNSSNIYFGDVAMNAAGVNQVFDNAYPHTIYHFSGLTRSVTFEGASFTTGTYVHIAKDVTEYAKLIGVDGYSENLAECSSRTGYFTNSPVHHILLGPYVDDAEAAKFGVPLDASYKTLDGVITWRELKGPYSNDAAAEADGVDVGGPYITTSWTIARPIGVPETVTLSGDQTLSGKKLTNFREGVLDLGNSGTAQTLSITAASIQQITLTGNCTFTMPAIVAGQSFLIDVIGNGTAYTATFTGVDWGGDAPTVNTASGDRNTFAFRAKVDGSGWVGTMSGDSEPPAWDDITGKPAPITALTGTNTGDQDLSGLLTSATAASTYAPISTTVTLSGTQTITGIKSFSSLNAVNPAFTGQTAMENMLVDLDAAFGQFGTIAFNGITYTYGTGSAAAHRTALGLGALATVTPGTNVATALAIAADATGGMFRQGQALSATTVTASGVVTVSVGTNAAPAIRHPSAAGTGIYFPFSTQIGLAISGSQTMLHGAGYVQIPTNSNPTFLMGASGDVALTRISPGVAGIATSFAGGSGGSLNLLNLTASGTVTATGGILPGTFTVGTFPTTERLMAVVTDALAPVAGAAVAAGGSAKALVMYAGSTKTVISPLL